MRLVTRFLFSSAALILVFGGANAGATPTGITLQGRLVKNGSPVENMVAVTLKITNIAKPGIVSECVLYEETHSLNLLNSDGMFSIKIGGGARTVNDEGLSLQTVFSNASVAVPNLSCTGSPASTSYTPQSADSRNVYVSFVDGADTVTFPAPYVILSVPYAMHAADSNRLGGKAADAYLETSANTTQTKLNDLMEPTAYTKLLALLDGTSNQYLNAGATNFTPSAPVNFNSQNITNATGVSLSPSANRTISVARQTVPDAPGNQLTIAASGATSGATDKEGGTLLLSSGTSTGSASSKIEFQTSGPGTSGTSDAAPSTKMTILGNGNVGIGTTNPEATLDVQGSYYSHLSVGKINQGGTVLFRRGSDGTVRAAIGMSDATTSSSFVIQNTATSGTINLQTHDGTSTATRLRIHSDGNVGIGTTAPGQKLEVNGTIKATDLILTSDRRAKSKITRLDAAEALDRICRLNPVSFKWNFNGKYDQGVIAQELRDIYPEMVIENPDGTLAVKYTSLIAPLISSVQELQKREEELRNSVTNLESENLALKARLRLIEEKLGVR